MDYFRIEVDQSGKLTAWATGNLDTEGELQNSAGKSITENYDDGPGDNFRIIHNVDPGTYYLTDYFGDAGSYTVDATLEPGDKDAGNTRGTATRSDTS